MAIVAPLLVQWLVSVIIALSGTAGADPVVPYLKVWASYFLSALNS